MPPHRLFEYERFQTSERAHLKELLLDGLTKKISLELTIHMVDQGEWLCLCCPVDVQRPNPKEMICRNQKRALLKRVSVPKPCF
jgi:hypothetical protein